MTTRAESIEVVMAERLIVYRNELSQSGVFTDQTIDDLVRDYHHNVLVQVAYQRSIPPVDARGHSMTQWLDCTKKEKTESIKVEGDRVTQEQMMDFVRDQLSKLQLNGVS